MFNLIEDLLHAARGWRRRPAFALVVTATLALALGPNAVIFSFVNVTLVRSLPVGEPERLGWLYAVDPQTGDDRARVSLPDYAAFRAGVPAFSALAGRMPRSATLGGLAGGALHVQANVVVGDLHRIWGLRAVLGRPLRAADERPGAPRVAVVSHRFWQRALGRQPDVIGRALRLDGDAYDVVGVLGPEIEIGSLSQIDVWLPLQQDPAAASPAVRNVAVVGRLVPGASIAQAAAQAAAVAARLAAEQPATRHGWRTRVVSTRQAFGGSGFWLTLALLSTVVGLLLLLACANVTNMLLARLLDRRRDLALRAALGASRLRIVRELLAEGLLLAAGGGVLGTALAAALLRLIRALAFDPFFQLLVVDRNVVAFAALLALVAPLLFVLPAALRAVGRDPAALLRHGAHTTGDRGVRRGRDVLVGLQMAIALGLLSVTVLVLRSVRAELAAPLGFDPARVLSLRTELGAWKYPDDAALAAAQRRLLARLAAVPGVERAALASTLPIVDDPLAVRLHPPGRAAARPEDWPRAELTQASEGLFAVLHVPFVAGRSFSAADRAGSPLAAIVNDTTARRFWGRAADAIGKPVALDLGDPGARPILAATVVGVVGDVRNAEPSLPRALRVYLAAAQQPPRGFALLLRAGRPEPARPDAGSPEALAASVRRAVVEVDPELAIFLLRPLPAAIAAEQQSNLIVISLLSGFAALALLLACLGLYGVMAYAVARRRQELAVRLACGAAPRDLRLLVLAQGMRLALAGSAAGLGLGLALAHLVSSRLFGVTAADVPSFAAAAAAIFATAFVGTLLPALRAESTSPAQALRGD